MNEKIIIVLSQNHKNVVTMNVIFHGHSYIVGILNTGPILVNHRGNKPNPYCTFKTRMI